MNTLAAEITKFREWAIIRQSPDYRETQFSHSSSEWECDYPYWHELYTAVDYFLKSASTHKLTSAEIELLLYALARDNEDEQILETLEEFEEAALQIAHAALVYADKDARWQAAVLLGRIGTSDAIALLKRFLADDVEYVRRRASFALQEAEV